MNFHPLGWIIGPTLRSLNHTFIQMADSTFSRPYISAPSPTLIPTPVSASEAAAASTALRAGRVQTARYPPGHNDERGR